MDDLFPSLLCYRPRIISNLHDQNYPGIEILDAFLSVYSIVSPVDTLDKWRGPIRMKNIFPLPSPTHSLPKDYEELCNMRALELLSLAEDGQMPLYVAYSGGIDSTLVIISLLKNATEKQKKNITILLSKESIAENPRFYHDYLYGKLNILSSLLLPRLLGGAGIFTNGEHNDQIFGTDVMGILIQKYGPRIIHQNYSTDVMFDLFYNSHKNRKHCEDLVCVLEKIIRNAPVSLVSCFDVFWWINFSLKWQSVYFRMLLSTDEQNIPLVTKQYIQSHIFTFYGTDEFRIWSMNNLHLKIKDSWESYKWHCKDIIYEFNKDSEYRDHKKKIGSLGHAVRQTKMYNAIDKNYNFLREVTVEKYYDSENDFIV